MDVVSDPGVFLADPFGRCFLGRRHLVFAHSPTFIGFAAWGSPDADDVRQLLGLCRIGTRMGAVPHRWLVDLRSLESVVPSTFGQFVDYVSDNGPRLKQTIIRQAQLRPPGLVGAIISGFSQIARLPYPERVFSDLEEAIAWLGVDRDLGLSVIAEIDAARSSSLGLHPIVSRLRQELARGGPLALGQAARRLGLSARSLQRALTDGGTSYRNELKAYQVDRAKELLREGREPMAFIAAEVGFSSLQHFATAFRRATGETPGAFRSRESRTAGAA